MALSHPGDPMSEIPVRLAAHDLTIGYDRRVVSRDLDVQIPDDSFTVIIGPNACGKSTLLRALSRLLKPTRGAVLLDSKEIGTYHPKEAARRIGLLPQSATAPDGISVRDLVSRGRHPHQSVFATRSLSDTDAVRAAMAATDVTELATVPVNQLSGGQRQRVWVAMALAQQTPLLLLDEPTTFLDIAHQIELMDLFARLHRDGSTLVAVLHDLNHAARYASHLIAMADGAIVAQGPPSQIVTAELVREVFGLACVVIPDPITGAPLVVPRSAEH